MVVAFVDLKVAFDSVDRRVLLEEMRKRRVREELVRRCEEVLRETVCRVRVGEREGVKFWAGKGLRQGFPGLFAIFLANIDKVFRKGGWEGVKVGMRKVYSLAYADDIALLAEDEEEIKVMLGRLEEYLDKKGFNLNVEKTKVTRWYGIVKGECIPEYLKKGWGESRCQRVAKFRLGA